MSGYKKTDGYVYTRIWNAFKNDILTNRSQNKLVLWLHSNEVMENSKIQKLEPITLSFDAGVLVQARPSM